MFGLVFQKVMNKLIEPFIALDRLVHENILAVPLHCILELNAESNLSGVEGIEDEVTFVWSRDPIFSHVV